MDYLIGSKGNNYLDGQKGGDVDVLKGGGGADVFQISDGTDFVEDFNIKQGDRIALTNNGVHMIIDKADGVMIKASNNEKLLLVDTNYDDIIAAGDEIFVIPV